MKKINEQGSTKSTREWQVSMSTKEQVTRCWMDEAGRCDQGCLTPGVEGRQAGAWSHHIRCRGEAGWGMVSPHQA